jgi:hypothetical protein
MKARGAEQVHGAQAQGARLAKMVRTKASAWLLCATVLVFVSAMLPVASTGWTEDDVWKAEFKLDELRDAVVDQVCTLESV